MKKATAYLAILFASSLAYPITANAWFLFFPIPNLSKPPALNSIIDALEKSDETKAVAYASEDKAFGAKMWVWGQFSGHVTQAEADRNALSQCERSLANAKAQSAGGKPLYDFGNKKCELYSFVNKTVSTRQSAPSSDTNAGSNAASNAATSPETTTQAKIDFPEGWESRPLNDAQKAAGNVALMTNRTTDSGLSLATTKRAGITDMAAFANSKRAAQYSRLQQALMSDINQLELNGLPAWRFEVTGNLAGGARYTYLQTIVEGKEEIVSVNVWTTAAGFAEQKGTLLKIVDSLTGLDPGTSQAKAEGPIKKSTAENEAGNMATEETRSLTIAEDSKKLPDNSQNKPSSRPILSKPSATIQTQIDFNAEANKSARILGCQPTELKVTGVESGNIQYQVICSDSKSLLLSCDSSGLCLQKKTEPSSKR